MADWPEDITFAKQPGDDPEVSYAKALFAYAQVNSDELTLQEGDKVVVLKKQSDGWWRGVVGNAVGLFPYNYVEECAAPPRKKPPPPKPSMLAGNSDKRYCKALYDYSTDDSGNISFAQGDVFELLDDKDQDWWRVKTSAGASGFAPANYVEPCAAPAVASVNPPPPTLKPKLKPTGSKPALSPTGPKPSFANKPKPAMPSPGKKPPISPGSKPSLGSPATKPPAPSPTSKPKPKKVGPPSLSAKPKPAAKASGPDPALQAELRSIEQENKTLQDQYDAAVRDKANYEKQKMDVEKEVAKAQKELQELQKGGHTAMLKDVQNRIDQVKKLCVR